MDGYRRDFVFVAKLHKRVGPSESNRLDVPDRRWGEMRRNP